VSSGPIIVLGVAPRSGTNLVFEQLCLHPDCAPQQTWFEDGLLLNASLLAEYCARTAQFRNTWPEQRARTEDLLSAIGAALLGSLDPGGGRLLTKTPSTRGIDLAPALFPDASVVVVVRDGLSTVASAKRTWGANVSAAATRWADGVRRLLQTQTRHVVVRYEDVVLSPVETMTLLLEQLGLPLDHFPFSEAERPPVRGSSELMGRDRDWGPQEAPVAFDPVQRGAELTVAERAKFSRIAGAEQRALGYPDTPLRHPGAGIWAEAERLAYRVNVRVRRHTPL